MKTKVGIINVTGYAGIELARILQRHPKVAIHGATGRSEAGKRLAEVFPTLWPMDLVIAEELPDDCEFVFSALPHKASAEALLPWIDKGIRVVDIAADFRLRSQAEYTAWYQVTPPRPALLESAVYGLTELRRDAVRDAAVVANPGCYPTAALLAAYPAIKSGLAAADLIVDAKSGISGGGRTLTLTNHYSEVNESVEAYALGGHRHMPEITQELDALCGVASRVTFIPHLVPMTRGILATCYLPFADDDADPAALKQRLQEAYRDTYAGEPFVHVSNASPATKHTYGSNRAVVHVTVDARARRIIAVGALDNLVKGASGQAVQNMNVMLGWSEALGLDGGPVYP